MELGYDPKKNAWNIQERGLSFEDVAALDWTTAMVRQDKRKDYGGVRYQAFIEGTDGKPYVVVFTMRGEVFWIISFRRAHDRERKSYAEEA
jgi:uncharacterized protein